jgi:hypothetical protein
LAIRLGLIPYDLPFKTDELCDHHNQIFDGDFKTRAEVDG